MVPKGPVLDIANPKGRPLRARWINGRERVIERYVEDRRDGGHADDIEESAGEYCDRSRFAPAEDGQRRSVETPEGKRMPHARRLRSSKRMHH